MRNIILSIAFACTLPIPAQAQNRAPTSAQLRDFVGQYSLEDGRVLTVSLPGRALVAQVTGQDAVLLQPAGPAQFVARTGVLRVAFEQHDNGVVTGVTVDTAR